MTKLRALLVAALMVLAIGVTAQPAQAGGPCNWHISCGKIYNRGGVATGVTFHWISVNGPLDLRLPVGRWSTDWGQDADGYYIGPGWCVSTYSLYHNNWVFVANKPSGWYKINDLQTVGLWTWHC